MWLMPLLVTCGASVYEEGGHKNFPPLCSAALLWLSILAFSAFVYRPIPAAAATMWILAAPSLLVIFLSERHVKSSLLAALVVLCIYAGGLILQEILHVSYTQGDVFNYSGRAWPLINPNNAAAVLNFGLIGTFWLALRRKMWFLVVLLFIAAMVVTKSRGGFIGGGVACFILMAEYYGRRFTIPALASIMAVGLPFLYFVPSIITSATYSLSHRYPIWDASSKLLTDEGLGLGSFWYYYSSVRTETFSAGSYAHNDLLQIWIETGLLGVATFSLLLITALLTTRRCNIAPACMIMAVFLQSLVEFQFYVPAVSLLFGLALVFHVNANPTFCNRAAFK